VLIAYLFNKLYLGLSYLVDKFLSFRSCLTYWGKFYGDLVFMSHSMRTNVTTAGSLL
jgi:hypothetical protein